MGGTILLVMSENHLTEPQRAALQRLRDQHTDQGFPPELNELLGPSWEGEHRLEECAYLTLERDGSFYARATFNNGADRGAHMSRRALTEAIRLLTEARDSLLA